jgi:hypothetical protein
MGLVFIEGRTHHLELQYVGRMFVGSIARVYKYLRLHGGRFHAVREKTFLTGRHGSLWKVTAAFPEQEHDQNTETARQPQIGGRQPGPVGDKAQSRLTNRQKNCEHQRLHGEKRRPDVV